MALHLTYLRREPEVTVPKNSFTGSLNYFFLLILFYTYILLAKREIQWVLNFLQID